MMFANPPRLHLNEHFSPRMAAQLRKRGFDVTSSQECGMLTEPDDVQLRFAAENGRAILSFNIKDFVRLHNQYMAEGKEHWGDRFVNGIANKNTYPPPVEAFSFCLSR